MTDAETSSSPKRNATKEEVLELMDKRKALEEELLAWNSILESEGGVGMHGPLVDNEDYPRNDIDVAKVREARHKVIVLQNDLKQIMRDIEAGLHNLHEQTRDGLGATDANDLMNKLEKLPTAFVRVDVVSPDSPAEYSGLKTGDLICEFGSLTSDNFRSLQSISTIVEASVGQNVRVRVIRDGAVKTLLLKPKTWTGRGLIGCHIKPLETEVDR